MYEKNKDKKKIVEDKIEAGCLAMEAEQVNIALRSFAHTIATATSEDTSLVVRFKVLCNTLQFALGNAELWGEEDKDILADLQDVLSCYH